MSNQYQCLISAIVSLTWLIYFLTMSRGRSRSWLATSSLILWVIAFALSAYGVLK